MRYSPDTCDCIITDGLFENRCKLHTLSNEADVLSHNASFNQKYVGIDVKTIPKSDLKAEKDKRTVEKQRIRNL